MIKTQKTDGLWLWQRMIVLAMRSIKVRAINADPRLQPRRLQVGFHRWCMDSACMVHWCRMHVALMFIG